MSHNWNSSNNSRFMVVTFILMSDVSVYLCPGIWYVLNILRLISSSSGSCDSLWAIPPQFHVLFKSHEQNKQPDEIFFHLPPNWTCPKRREASKSLRRTRKMGLIRQNPAASSTVNAHKSPIASLNGKEAFSFFFYSPRGENQYHSKSVCCVWTGGSRLTLNAPQMDKINVDNKTGC